MKAYKEGLKDCSHINSPGVLNNTLLSQGYILETVPHVGRVGEMYIPRTGEGGEKSLIAHVQLMVQPKAMSS